MQMKKMLLAAAMTLAGSVMADVSVEDVKCTQRYPWNGLVDIEYTIACDDPEADVYVNPVAYDGDRRLTLFPSAFTGDGATNTVKAGRHKMVWDAKKDLGSLFSSKNFQIKMYAGKRLSRYVVVDLSSGPDSTDYPIRLSHVGPDLSNDTCRTTELWLRLVPPGEFWMGSPADEIGHENDEDLHHVTFTKPFYIGVFEVTMKQWDLVTYRDYTPLFNTSSNRDIRPITNQRFSYMRGNFRPNAKTGFDTNYFIGKLRSRTRAGAFDLPTESRWEYACRAGTVTALYNGRNLTDTTVSAALSEIAAYYGNRYNDASYNDKSVAVGTTPVGSFHPNALGLYDMLGNVWETCRDGLAFGKTSGLGTEDVIDPEALGGTDSYGDFVVRGGCWRSPARENRAADRKRYDSNDANELVGFRVCAEAEF